jgi:hypothetical protein
MSVDEDTETHQHTCDLGGGEVRPVGDTFAEFGRGSGVGDGGSL